MPESVNEQRTRPPAAGDNELLGPLGEKLMKLPTADRIRALGSLLITLADQEAAAGPQAGGLDAEGLGKRLQRLGEAKAQADDELAAVKADLASRLKQGEAEQQRSAELERIVADQRDRLRAAQTAEAELEQQLVAKNQQLYEAENKVEGLTLQLQRAELKAGDSSKLNELEDGRRELIVQLEELREAYEQLRVDKDQTIEELKSKVGAERASAGAESSEALASLWDRLARAKPPLAPGGVQPSVKSAERLFDAFIELAHFVHDFDQALRPFLNSFIRHHSTLRRPWEVYARSPGLNDTIREVIDVRGGKPASILKMLLRQGLQRWTVAAMIGSDTAIESIAHELEQNLRGEAGMAADLQRRIRDYLRDDGHHVFHQHMRELRGEKLAEAYTHGAYGG